MTVSYIIMYAIFVALKYLMVIRDCERSGVIARCDFASYNVYCSGAVFCVVGIFCPIVGSIGIAVCFLLQVTMLSSMYTSKKANEYFMKTIRTIKKPE